MNFFKKISNKKRNLNFVIIPFVESSCEEILKSIEGLPFNFGIKIRRVIYRKHSVKKNLFGNSFELFNI